MSGTKTSGQNTSTNHYSNWQLICSQGNRNRPPLEVEEKKSSAHFTDREVAELKRKFPVQNSFGVQKSSPQQVVTTSGGDSIGSSSGSSANSSDRVEMLGMVSSAKGNQMQQMQREHLALHQQQQQRQRQLQQQRHHQQQMAVANNNNNKSNNKLAQQAADNLTSSSSSDPSTVDELHNLATSGHHNHQHHHHHNNTISHNRHNQHLALGAGARAAAAAAAAAANISKRGAEHPLGPPATGGVGSSGGGRFLLGVLFTWAELLLFVAVLLWLYWSYQHDDGLAWQNDRKQQFNLHAALMLFGFIFLSGQAMLIHRSFQCCNRIYTKIMHTILFVLATSAISLGLILAYTAQENVGQNTKSIMHFYSLHAWCGLATVGLFTLQFSVGFISFLILLCCDQSTMSFRAALLPIHKTFGLIIFNLAVATCLMGLLQTARSRLSSKLNKIDYHELAESGVVINSIGVCLILLAILMPYIIRNLDMKRPDDCSASASSASSSSASFRSEYNRQLNKLSQYENLRI